VDFEADPGTDIRTQWQNEVLLEFAQRLQPTFTQLPSRALILKWVGVPYEALEAIEEYSLGGNLYGFRIFDNRASFEKALRSRFPQSRFSLTEALISNSGNPNQTD